MLRVIMERRILCARRCGVQLVHRIWNTKLEMEGRPAFAFGGWYIVRRHSSLGHCTQCFERYTRRLRKQCEGGMAQELNDAKLR